MAKSLKRTGMRIVVIGLGRFGASVARELIAQGAEVLGLDVDERRVQPVAAARVHEPCDMRRTKRRERGASQRRRRDAGGEP